MHILPYKKKNLLGSHFLGNGLPEFLPTVGKPSSTEPLRLLNKCLSMDLLQNLIITTFPFFPSSFKSDMGINRSPVSISVWLRFALLSTFNIKHCFASFD